MQYLECTDDTTTPFGRVATAAAVGAPVLCTGPAQAAPLIPAQTTTALNDEYHALATFQVVTEQFGAAHPFGNIIKAEQRRIDAILKASGQAVPANPYLNGKKPRPVGPATLQDACAIGVQADIANAALYDDRLPPAAQGNARLATVLTALRDAPENNHLPAFRRCAR